MIYRELRRVSEAFYVQNILFCIVLIQNYDYLYIFLSAPLMAPQNVTASAINATAISVCFDPPTGSSQNGIITSFTFTFTGSTFQTTQLVTTVPVSLTEYPLNRTVCTNLTNLEENNTYTISVLLTNSAGSGSASADLTVLTPVAGECL